MEATLRNIFGEGVKSLRVARNVTKSQFSCVFAAFLFHTILVDVVARGFHIVAATVCYIIYFIFESYENTIWAEANDVANDATATVADYNDYKKKFNTRVTALVFAALNVIFLILATVYFFFQMKERKVEVEEGNEPPTDDEQ